MAYFQTVNRHLWPGTETLETRLGHFEFRGGYPTAAAAAKLSDYLVFSRAVEAYLTHLPSVSWYRVWKAIADAGVRAPQQMVIRDNCMDAATLLLTGQSEGVYGLAAIDLQRDGPVVVEVPAGMVGGITDMRQRELCGIGPSGVEQGRGGRLLLIPPDPDGPEMNDMLRIRCTTYGVVLGVRPLEEATPDAAVALMRSIRIFPLAQIDQPPPTTFVNGSPSDAETMFPDCFDFYEDLAHLMEREPAPTFDPHDRIQLAAIGIARERPFRPDAIRRSLLAEAVRVGAAMARTHAFASTDPSRLAYPDRRWEWLPIGRSWEGPPNTELPLRGAFVYSAIGVSPALVLKLATESSQYFWTSRDASGGFLDGGRCYRLRLPANLPAARGWAVTVYDAQTRSMLRTSQRAPIVSLQSAPEPNLDGSVAIVFDPRAPRGKARNWIQTIEGRGWFPLLRLNEPLPGLFDRTWKPGDIEMMI